MIKDNHGTGHIIQSLIVNLLIVFAKGFAAFMTNSGAMLAETIHSFADCANQALLLLGVKQAKRPADDSHQFGYGMSAYFWSFMVAMLLFSVGGMFSIYEGWHKLHHPEPMRQIWWGVGVLVFSLILEGYATISNIKSINQKRKKSFMNYITTTKDSDLIVVFGENSAAVLGLFFALMAMLASYFTGNPSYDAIGSIIIGVILICVAIFLAKEVHSLLIGESADEEVIAIIQSVVSTHPSIENIINIRTIQQGPGNVLACIKIKVKSGISAVEISKSINDMEAELRRQKPEVRYIYIEPDLQEWSVNS